MSVGVVAGVIMLVLVWLNNINNTSTLTLPTPLTCIAPDVFFILTYLPTLHPYPPHCSRIRTHPPTHLPIHPPTQSLPSPPPHPSLQPLAVPPVLGDRLQLLPPLVQLTLQVGLHHRA